MRLISPAGNINRITFLLHYFPPSSLASHFTSSLLFLSPMQEADPPAPSWCLTTSVCPVSVLELAENQSHSHLHTPTPHHHLSSRPSFTSHSPFWLQSVHSGPSTTISTTSCLIRGGTKAHGHIVRQYQPAPVSAHCPHLPSSPEHSHDRKQDNRLKFGAATKIISG